MNILYTFSDQISSLSKSCYMYSHIRELRCIRPYFDSKNSQYHRCLCCPL